jgi:hypothetical protein
VGGGFGLARAPDQLIALDAGMSPSRLCPKTHRLIFQPLLKGLMMCKTPPPLLHRALLSIRGRRERKGVLVTDKSREPRCDAKTMHAGVNEFAQ